MLASWRSLTKRAGTGSGSESESGSECPCMNPRIRIRTKMSRIRNIGHWLHRIVENWPISTERKICNLTKVALPWSLDFFLLVQLYPFSTRWQMYSSLCQQICNCFCMFSLAAFHAGQLSLFPFIINSMFIITCDSSLGILDHLWKEKLVLLIKGLLNSFNNSIIQHCWTMPAGLTLIPGRKNEKEIENSRIICTSQFWGVCSVQSPTSLPLSGLHQLTHTLGRVLMIWDGFYMTTSLFRFGSGWSHGRRNFQDTNP
jgi:hypothetical protein